MKKQLIFLGTFSTTIIPLATIISCGNNNENKDADKGNEEDSKEEKVSQEKDSDSKDILNELKLSTEEEVKKLFNGDFVISSPVKHQNKITDINFFSQPLNRGYWGNEMVNLEEKEHYINEKVYDDFYNDTIPLAKTKFAQNQNNSLQSEDHKLQLIYRFSNPPVKEQRTPVGTASSDESSNVLFSNWSYVDQVIDWGKRRTITVPKPEDINIAHLNGKKILGTMFFPWGDHPRQYDGMIQKDENGDYIVAKKMIEIANKLGFDGWFFNLEAFDAEETERQGNIGDKFELKDDIAALEKEIEGLQQTDPNYQDKIDELQEKRLKFHTFNIPEDIKKEVEGFFKYFWDNKGDLTLGLYQYGIGEMLFDKKQFDKYFVDFQVRNNWKEKLKSESKDVVDATSYGYWFAKYFFNMERDVDDKWHPDGDTLDFTDYPSWWTYDFLNTDYPDLSIEKKFFSGYKNDNPNWTPANKWFLETTTIIDETKPFSSAFSLGLGEKFYLFGKKSKFDYRNAGLQDILPTYRYLNYFYKKNNQLIKEERNNERSVQNIQTAGDGFWNRRTVPYFGSSVLNYDYTLADDEQKLVNKLFATNMKLKEGASFKLKYNGRGGNIDPKLALWYDENDSTKFIEVEPKSIKNITDWKNYQAIYKEAEFEIDQSVLDQISGNDKNVFAFGTVFEKGQGSNENKIKLDLGFVEYIPPNYQAPSKKDTLELEKVNTIWTKNVLTNKDLSVSATFDKDEVMDQDFEPNNLRSSALTLKFKDFKPGQAKINVFYSSKLENGFEKDKIIAISQNNSVVINDLPISKDIPIIVETYDFNHKLIGKNNFVLRTPFE